MNSSFRNDYDILVHPRYLSALTSVASERNIAYGIDRHSVNAASYIRDTFGCPSAEIHFVTGGTMANLLFLSFALRPFEAVLCCVSAHINVHEAGAVEGSGHKIVTVEGHDGKISAEDVERYCARPHDEHVALVKAVYISDAAETGTIYQADELKALSAACKRHGLYLFLDGARLGAALTCEDNDVEPSLLGETCDAFYIGGTKNGMMLGEALVLVNPVFDRHFRNHMKNRGGMLAKGFLIGAQFEEAFKDGFYFDLAYQTNAMAAKLKAGLDRLGISYPYSPTNQVFLTLPSLQAEEAIEAFGCEKWSEDGPLTTIRFVTSFCTSDQEIADVLSFLENL